MIFHVSHINIMEVFFSTIISFVVLLVIIVVLIQVLFGRTRPNYPPGPTALPLFGNFFSIAGGDGFYNNLLKLRQRYGDIFRLCLGDLSMIVVFGNQNIHEVLVEKGEITKARPNWLYIPDKVIQRKGLFWNNGEEWWKLTQLLVNTQKDKDIREHTNGEVLKEIEATVDEIMAMNGAPLDPEKFMTRSLFNISSSFILGRRFDHDDPDFKFLVENVTFIMQNSGSGSLVNMHSWLSRFSSSKFERLRQAEEKIFDYLRKQLKEHEVMLMPSVPGDYLDMYLTLDPEEKKHSAYSEHNFLRSVIDFLQGGNDTATSMLLWQLVYMVRYPKVQEKCQEEMDKVLSGDSTVSFNDMEKLPYTIATLKELRRIALPTVHTPLRSNTEEMTIGQYTIPKDSIIICELKAPHLDETYWPDPLEFRPERFLEPITADKPFHPFGLGPRPCVGTILGEDLLFLYFANILHTFTLKDGGTRKPVTLEGRYTGVTLRPKASDISFIARNEQLAEQSQSRNAARSDHLQTIEAIPDPAWLH